MAIGIHQNPIGLPPTGLSQIPLSSKFPKWEQVPQVTKYNPGKNSSIIGIQPSPAPTLTTLTDSGTLTATTFDTTTRADAAKILLTNNGTSLVLRDAFIRAATVTKVGGQEGYLNDSYVDYDSIAQNGEIKYELGNDFIVTLDQVNKLADIKWKESRMRRHIYSISLIGFCSWFEPGEWYTLTIGAAGTAEYISAVCECYQVRMHQDADNIGYTSVAFREMYQNWKFDSNETARTLASGRFNRTPSQTTVVVGSSTYPGDAFLLCDSAADDVQINSAIKYLAGRGGGTVQLTEGTFNLAAVPDASYNNIRIVGSGPNTILVPAAGVVSYQSNGVVGTHISGCSLENLTISNPNQLHIQYSDYFVMRNVNLTGTFTSANAILYILNCNGVQIVSNTFDAQNVASSFIYCINFDTVTNSFITKNNLSRFRVTGSLQAISINTCTGLSVDDNIVYDISTSNAGGNVAVGMTAACNVSAFKSNRIEMVKNSGIAANAYGVNIATSSTNNLVVGNYCYNNGNDAAIANTGKNFLDSGTTTRIGSNSWQL